MMIDFALGLAIVALIPLFVYFFHRLIYSPKIFFRVGGEQMGEPIQVPKRGRLHVSIGAKSSHKVLLPEFWIGFNENQVDLPAKGAEERTTLDRNFPLAILFTGNRIVAEKDMQGFYCDYTAASSEFSLKLVAFAQTDETELPLLIDMFASKKVRAERIVKFKVVSEASTDLKKAGLLIKPGEAIHVDGPQAQEAVWAVAEKEGQN